MMRWNASFIRGLAQSVLDRARKIRSGLETPAPVAATKPKRKPAPARKKKKTTKRKSRG